MNGFGLGGLGLGRNDGLSTTRNLNPMMKKPWPAEILMLTAIASIQLGAVLAKQLFDAIGYVGALGVSHLLAAILLFLWQRPVLGHYSWADRRLTLAMGLVLGGVYLCFYGAIEQIPLGIAIAFQFVGPLGLAVLKSHKRLDLLWIGMAMAGLVLLSPLGQSRLNPLGVGLALCAGLLMAVYIMLAPHVGRRFHGQDGVALAMACSSIFLLPVTLHNSAAFVADPMLLLIGAGVACLAAIVPFCLDTVILQRTEAQTFGLWLSLEPAIATLIGWIFLGEQLNSQAVLGIILISIAAAGHSFKREAVPPDEVHSIYKIGT